MLTLQRASAGSGKTYTLTKQYITMLLTVQDEKDGRRRLRVPGEVADGVKRILAVTFTNKATNEMKERILSKLNAIAFLPENREEYGSVDYLSDLVRDYDSSAEEISGLAKIALREVLYQYSDFNVSTIDAFFQTILRTFAYESDLPDAYNLIIDAKYLALTAARDLVDDFARGHLSDEELFWLNRLVRGQVEAGSNSWKVFQRKESGASWSPGLFRQLVGMGEALEKEEYKHVKESLDDYYQSGVNLRDAYRKIEAEISGKFKMAAARISEICRKVVEIYSAIAEDPSTGMPPKVRQSGPQWGDIIFGKSKTVKVVECALHPDADVMRLPLLKEPKSRENVFASQIKPSSAFKEGAIEAVGELLCAYREYSALLDSTDVQVWNLISPGLPRIALMHNLKGRIADYLSDNGAMQLADANTILRKIISDDDVPFIYERIGTRINHFLIDEFQDTSLLQWENFKPLLSQSIGSGMDNLIIGDAKQSIYRFRSAEPKIITSIVPAAFDPALISQRGYSEKENTNWRSSGNVVRFNNFFFHFLSRYLDETYNKDWNMPKLGELYSNTVQRAADARDLGYVRIECVGRTDSGETTSDTSGLKDGSKIDALLTERIGDLICSLLGRGYSQKHIAILVNTREAGVEIISGLMEYALLKGESVPQLKFVSEDSLKLSRSAAVTTIVECFRMIESGSDADKAESRGKPSSVSGRINWADIGNRFRYYSSGKGEKTLEERLKGFLRDGVDFTEIDSLMEEMQAVTLPSLVESLTEHFVSPRLRSEDAPFLAAFQDAVLDYCESNPADIGSFLNWWDARGKELCISSPEGLDAISVMTIHASKGLEYRCVILPELNLNFKMKEEWKWIPMPKEVAYAGLLPGNVLVEVGRAAAESTSYTPYRRVFEELQFMHEADLINKAYVAFTRAIDELYVFLPPFKQRDNGNRFNMMAVELLGKASSLVGGADDEIKPSMPEEGAVIHYDEGGNRLEVDSGSGEQADCGYEDSEPDPGKDSPHWGTFIYGSPLPDVGARLAEKNSVGSGRISEDLKDYYVNSARDLLKYHPEGLKASEDPADDDRSDPRSEGSRLHAVLENVIVRSDLPRALEMQRVRGLISRKEMGEIKQLLEHAMDFVESRGWFGGGFRVLNERPFFEKGDETHRPDRVMTDAAGGGIVVDYKFGDSTNRKAYHRQVRRYMDKLLASGLCSSAEGYVWYVRHDLIERVEG